MGRAQPGRLLRGVLGCRPGGHTVEWITPAAGLRSRQGGVRVRLRGAEPPTLVDDPAELAVPFDLRRLNEAPSAPAARKLAETLRRGLTDRTTEVPGGTP